MTEHIQDQRGAAPPPPPIPPYANASAFTPSGLSITAFVLGILSFVTCGPCFGIPAIVIGLIELQKIKNRTASAEGHAARVQKIADSAEDPNARRAG